MNTTEEIEPVTSRVFYVAALDIDGSYDGIGVWDSDRLSPKWLAICNDLLLSQGEAFDYTWREALSHIRTRFTSSDGAAVVTFFVAGQVGMSILLMRGNNKAIEREVAGLFTDSLHGVKLMQQAPNSESPFECVFTILERPVMVVVPFPGDRISGSDYDVVRELSLHLASAFLCPEV